MLNTKTRHRSLARLGLVGAVFLGFVSAVEPQSAEMRGAGQLLLHSPDRSIPSAPSASTPAIPSAGILREIDDPHNGDRWLLFPDPRHPAGPAKLLRVPLSSRPLSAGADTVRREEPTLAHHSADALESIIRAGERIVLEESSPEIQVRLEGVAMGSATIGSPFNARLSLGGRVVRAVATSPGRASLEAGATVSR